MKRVRSAPPDLDARIARRLRQERDARQLTLDALAERSGVSRAMISRIERGESSPTAALLGRLCGGLDITLSTLFADVDAVPSPIARRDDQTVWRDPATGYVRRAVSPPNTGSVQDIVDVTLPAGARVAYPAAAYRGIDQHVLVLDGDLEFGNGGEVHRLGPGDCLFVAHAADSWFRNPGRRAARYLVVLARLAAAPDATSGRARAKPGPRRRT
ncbi:MAG: helix-turn-helix domain-containing protein [Alphaproteobacteria bacterium]|nr:helix-turn-helix domain-containing protein [Alphaproteobacteria bacterium]